jgi:hypothetical protein
MVDLEALFPRLQGSPYQITSPPTQSYNCIAWATGDNVRWWWPDLANQRYWPIGVPRIETVAAFIQAYETLGYVPCQDETLESGFEKIAHFADEAGPQHAARQLSNGRWTSKLGELQDIEHDLHDLEGTDYGNVVAYMKRPVVAE